MPTVIKHVRSKVAGAANSVSFIVGRPHGHVVALQRSVDAGVQLDTKTAVLARNIGDANDAHRLGAV